MPEPRYSVNPEAKTIDFTTALTVDQLTLGDIYQLEKNYNYNVLPPTDIFQVRAGQPELSEEERQSMSQSINQAYKSYRDMAFNTTGTSMRTLPNTEHNRLVYPNIPKLYPGFSEQPYDTNLEFPEGIVKVQTEGVEADNFPYAKTKDDLWVPTQQLIKKGGYIQWVPGDPEKNEPNFYWKEVGDNEIVNADRMRTVFGAEQMDSKWFESIGRSIYAGAWGYTIKGIGGFVGTVGDIVSLRAFNGSAAFEQEEGKMNWWKDFERYTTNAANYNIHRNYDERMGFHDDVNSALWNVFNVFGQAAGIIATSLVTYGAGGLMGAGGRALGAAGLGRISAQATKLGTYLSPRGIELIGREASNLAKISRRAALAMGGAQAAAMMKEEVRAAGGSEARADRWFFPFFTATVLSESLLSFNMIQNIGGKSIGKYFAARPLLLKKAVNTEAKREIIDGVVPSHIGKQNSIRRMRDKFIDWQYNTVNWLDDNKVARYTLAPLLTGVEETVEEVTENTMYSMLGGIYNTVSDGIADTLHAKYRGIDYIPNNQKDIYEGDYLAVDNYGKVLSSLNQSQYDEVTDEKMWLEKYNKGETKINTSFNAEELYSIFLGSLLTGGLGSIMTSRKSKQDEINALHVAIAEKRNPNMVKANNDIGQWFVQTGRIGNNEFASTTDASGNPIKAGTQLEDGTIVQSEAQERWNAFRAKVDLYKDLMDLFSLNSKEVLDAINNNTELLSTAIVTAEEIEGRKKLAEELKSGKKPESKYYKEGLTPEKNAELLQNAEERLQDITKVDEFNFTSGNGTSLTAKRSKAYRRAFLTSALIDNNIEVRANQAALMDDTVKSAVGKPGYEEVYQNVVNKKKKELLTAYNEGNMSMSKLDYVGRYITAHSFNYEKDGTLANRLLSFSRSVVEAYNQRFEDVRKEDDALLATNINTVIAKLEEAIPNIVKYDQMTKELSGMTQEQLDARSEEDVNLYTQLNTAIISLRNFTAGNKSLRMSSLGDMIKAHNQIAYHRGLKGEKMNSSLNLTLLAALEEVFSTLGQETQEILGKPVNTDVNDFAKFEELDFDKLENLTDEMKADVLNMFMDNLLIPGTEINMKNFLAENTQIANSKTAIFKDPASIAANLDKIAEHLGLMSLFFDANVNLIQQRIEKNDDIAENSPIVREPKLKYNQDHLRQINGIINQWNQNIDAIYNQLEHSEEFLALDYAKKKIAALSVDLAIMETLYDIRFESELKDLQGFIKETINNIGYLIHKGKIDEKAPTRQITIGEKKFELRDFDDFYLVIVEAYRNDRAVFDQLNKLLWQIEKQKNKFYSSLHGKLDGILEKIKNELEPKITEGIGDDAKVSYRNIVAFENETLFDRNQTTLDATFSKKNFEIGRNEYFKFIEGKGVKNEEFKFFVWQFTTTLNRINKAGEKGTHTYMQCYKAIADYQKKTKGREVLTYEQEQVVLQMLMFSEDPTQSLSKNNILNIIGYNGTGKSTVVLRNFFGAKAILNKGKKTKVLFIAPTKDVRKLHMDAAEELKDLVNAEYTYLHQINTKEIKDGKYDIVLLDESSLVPSSTKKFTLRNQEKVLSLQQTLIDISKENVLMTLGDDAQVMPMFSRDSKGVRKRDYSVAWSLLYNSERTYPLTKIWRSSQISHYNLFDYFRKNYILGKGRPDPPSFDGEWKFSSTTGKRLGLQYFSTERDVIKAFLDDVRSGANVEDVMLVVLADEERQAMFLDKEYGADLKKYEQYIRTVDYDPMYVSLNEDNRLNDSISGASAKRVYVTGILQREFGNQTTNSAINEKSMMHSGNEQAGRAMLTAVSRAKEYIGLIGDVKLNKESTKTDAELLSGSVEPDMSLTNEKMWEVNNLKGGRYEVIIDAEGVEAGDENIQQNVETDFSARLLNTDRDQVKERALPIFDKLKGSISDAVKHLTSLLNPPSVSENEFSREEKRFIRMLFDMTIAGESREEIMKKAVEWITNEEKGDKNFVALFNEFVETKTEFTAEALAGMYMNTIQLSHNLATMMSTGVPVSGLAIPITYKDETYFGHPYVVDIIGFEEVNVKEGDNVIKRVVPVVDIHELNFVMKDVKPSEYTLRKVGAYILALNANNIKVNNVYVHNASLSMKERSTFFITHELSPEEKLNGLTEAAKALDMKPEPSESYFAGAEVIKGFKRIDRSVFPEYEIGEQLYNNGEVFTIVEKFSLNGKAGLQLINERTNGILETTELKNYEKMEVPFMFSTTFNEAAQQFQYTNGALWSSNAVFIAHESWKKLKNVYHVFDKKGKIVNRLLHARHLMLKYLTKGTPISKGIATTGLLEVDSKTGMVKGELKQKGLYDNIVVSFLGNNEHDEAVVRTFLEGAVDLYEFLSGEQKVTEAGMKKAVDTFFEYGLNILGHDGMVDYDYGWSKQWNRKGTPLDEAMEGNVELQQAIKDYMDSGSEEDLDRVFKDSFTNADETDMSQASLITLNKERMRVLRLLRSGKPVKGQIVKFKPGRVVTSIGKNTPTDFTHFIDEIYLSGATIESDALKNILVFKDSNGRFIKVKRLFGEITDPEQVRIHGKKVTKTYFNKLLEDIKNFETLILDFRRELKKAKQEAEDAGMKLTKKEKKVLGLGVFEHMRELQAYEFIEANQKVLREELAKQTSPIRNYLHWEQRWRMVELNGATLEDKFRSFKGLMKHLKDLVEKEDSSYVSKLRMHIIQRSDYGPILINENIEVNGTTFTQASIYIRPDIPAVKQDEGEEVNDIKDFTRISTDPIYSMDKEYALSQIRDLIGGLADSDVFFNTSFPQGTDVLGYLDPVMKRIFLKEFKGKVDQYTPRHEAHHYMMLHLLNPIAYANIIRETKDLLKSKGRNYSERDALEYLADIFMTGEYKSMHKGNIIKRFIVWLRKVFGIWNEKRFDVYSSMVAFDSGFFRDRSADYANYASILYHRKGRWNDPKGLEAIRKKLAYSDADADLEVEHILHRYIYRKIANALPNGFNLLNYSDDFVEVIRAIEEEVRNDIEKEFGLLGKSIDNKDGTYSISYFTNSQEGIEKRRMKFKAYVRKNDQNIVVDSNEMFQARMDEDGVILKDQPFVDVLDATEAEYRLARRFEKFPETGNSDAVHKYIMKVIGNVRINKQGKVIFDMNNLMYLLQIAFGNKVQLDSIMMGRPVGNHQGQFISVEQLSHKGLLSDQLKLIVESVRLRHSKTSGVVKKDFFYSDKVHMNMDIVDKYASFIVRNMRKDRAEMTLEEFFRRMSAQIEYINDSLERDTLYTFLITFGHQPNQFNKRFIEKGAYGFSLYSMVVNNSYHDEMKKWYMDNEGLSSEQFETAWEIKKDRWRSLLIAMDSYFFSEVLNVKENVNTQFQSVNSNAADILQNISSDVSKMLKGNNFNYHFGVNNRITRLLGETKETKAEKKEGGINRLYFDNQGIYYFEDTKKEYIILKKSQYTYSMKADKDILEMLFEMVGYKLQGDEASTIAASMADNDKLAGIFYNMLLGLKVDMMLQDEYTKYGELQPDIHTLRAYSKNNALFKLYDELMQYYDNDNLTVSTHNTKFSKDNVQYRGIEMPVFSPDDFWRFNMEHVMPVMLRNRGYVIDKRQKNIEGEFEQTAIVTGFLFDEIADAYGSSFPFAVSKINKMEGQIGALFQNNNLFKRRIEFDGLKNIGGREHKNRSLKFGNMTPVDIMAFLETQFLKELSNSRERALIPAIMDAIADKSRQPFAKLRHTRGTSGLLFSGARVKYFKNRMTGVHGLNLNYVRLGEMLLSIHEYYTGLQAIKKANWNKISKMSIEQAKLSDYKLDEDYMIKDGKLIPGAAVTMEDNPFINPEFKALANAIKKDSQEQAMNHIHNIFKSKFADLEQYLNDIRYDSPLFKPLATVTSGQSTDIYDDLSEQYRNEKGIEGEKNISDQKLTTWLREKWDDHRGVVIMSPDGQWNSFAETLFFGHMIFNESFNPLVRGSSYMYKDMIDYIKRGTGMIAPGAVTSRDQKLTKSPKQDRVFVIDDLEDIHSLFNGKTNPIESAVFLAPWRQERLYRDFGANLGPIHEGASKTVNFYLNPVDDDLFYLKCAMFPISGELLQYDIYRNMTEFMLGKLNDVVFYNLATQQFTTEFSNANITILDALSENLTGAHLLMYDPPKYMDIRQKLTDFLDNNPVYNDMTVGYIAPISAVKRGARRIHSVGKGLADMKFDKNLNNPDHTILVDSSYMRLQQETYQDVEDPYKNIMTQLLYVINALNHNQGVAKSVSSAIAESTNNAAREVQAYASVLAKDRRAEFLQREGLKTLGERLIGTKTQRILLDQALHADVLRKQHFKAVVGFVNDHIKPEVAGQSYVQAPFLGQLYFDEFGRPYVPRDFFEPPVKMTKRFINPINYERFNGTTWESITDKNYLKGAVKKDNKFYGFDGAEIRYRPAEVLLSFHHFNTFGVTADMTMRQAMSVRSDTQVADPMVTKTGDTYEFYTYGVEAPKIRSIISAMGVRTVWNNLTDSQRNVIFPPYEGHPEAHVENVTDQTLLDNLVRYFTSFNSTLDLLAVRIPTTIASSGFTGRVVGFINDTQNTIYHSPLKNILDGSDFDIDALQVYFRKLRPRERMGGNLWDRDYDLDTKDAGNKVFEQMLTYYNDVRNHSMILTKIDLSELIRRAGEKKKEYNASQLAKYMDVMNINQSSKRLVGHFANLNQFIFTLAYHAEHARQLYAKEDKTEFNNLYSKATFLLTDEGILRAAEFVTNLTNAATDNPKLGGILGLLNINEATSPVIAGLVLMGYNQTQILDILEMPSMRALSDTFYANRKADSEWSKPTYMLIGDRGPSYEILDKNGKSLGKKYMIEDLKERGLDPNLIRDAAEAGEQMRRLGDISAIQSREFKTDEQRFYNAYESMRVALGISPAEFVRTHNPPILTAAEQAKKFIEDMPNAGKFARIPQETRIRSAFNILHIVSNTPKLYAFVNAAAQLNRFMDNTFSSHNQQVVKKVRLLTGTDRITFDNFYATIINETDKFLVSAFIEHQIATDATSKPTLTWMENGQQVSHTYDITTPQGRYDFVSNFPRYVDWLKHNIFTWKERDAKTKAAPTFVEFLSKVNVRKAWGYNTHDIVEFTDSAYKTEYEKAAYADSFKSMPPIDKQNFRYYQLLLYGFNAPNNSFGDVTDNAMEKLYTEWIKTFNVAAYSDIIALEIVRHNIGLLKPVYQMHKLGYSQYGYRPVDVVGPLVKDAKKRKHYPMFAAIGELKKSKRLIAQFVPGDPDEAFAKTPYDVGKFKAPVPAKYSIISFSTPNYINPYYFKFDENGIYINQAHGAKAILDLSREDMDEYTRTGEIVIKGYNMANLISADEETDWTELSKNIVEGSVVVMPDNSAAIATIESGGIKLKSPYPKAIQSNITFTHQRVAAELIDYATRKIRAMFPNIRMRYTTTNDPENIHPNSIAYFGEDGMLWINTDRIQYDTPLHELSHIVVDLIWNSDSVRRDMLMQEAIMLYNTHDALRNGIDAYYADHSFEDKMKEVISTVIGWESAKDVRRTLYKMRITSSENIIQKIWNQVKYMLNELKEYIKSLTKSAFGTNITLDKTIKELYDSLLADFKNGNETNTITTEQYAELLNGKEHFQNAQNPGYEGRVEQVKDVFDMVDHLLSGTIYKGRISKDITFDNELIKLKAGIDKMADINQKGLSLDSTEMTEAIHERVFNKNQEKEKFDQGIIEWLESGADVNVFNEKFATSREDKDQFSWSNIRKLKTAIHYKTNTKYVRYSQLKDMAEYAHLYSEDMEGYDPIIAIEYKDDKQTVLRVYDLTYDDVDPIAMRSRKDSLAHRYLSTSIAKSLGIAFSNNLVNLRMFATGMLAAHMMRSDSKVKVIDMGIMQVKRASDVFPSFWIDPIRLRNTLIGLNKIDEFTSKIISKDILAILNNPLRMPDVDYLNLLRFYYQDMDDLPKTLQSFRDEPDTDLKEIGTILNIRLVSLLKRQKETIETGRTDDHDTAMEIEMITNALVTMRSAKLVDGTLNTFNSLGLAESWLYDSASIGNDAVQIMRNITLNSSRSIVSKVMQWKEQTHGKGDHKGENKGLYDYILEVYHRQHPGGEYFSDTTGDMFEPLIAKIQDTEGNWRNTPFIYWTKDESKCTTEIEKYFARRAKELNIDDDLIKVGEALVNKTEELAWRLLKHYRLYRSTGYGWWNSKTKAPYSDEDAKEELFSSTGYIRGMIPVLPKRGAEYFKEMKLYEGFRKRFHEISDPREMDDHSMIVEYPSDEMDTIHDRFFKQFGWNADPSERTSLGMTGVLDSIGLRQVLVPGNKEGESKVAFETKSASDNENMSYDLEKLMDYFVMTTERVIEYESNVLPVVNGLKVMLQDMNDGWQINTKDSIKYMNSFTRQGIQGTRERVSKGDYELEAFSMAGMATVSPLVMTFNVNVALVGSISAGMLSFMEAINSSFSKDNLKAFTLADLTKANAYVFANWSTVGQLMVQYGVMNMSEYDLLAHRTRQKTKKHPFSSYISNWMNWSSDYFARAVIMTAMMIHDDSLKAYSVDPNSRTIVYDEKKDGQFFNAEGKFKSEEAEAYYHALKRKIITDGIHNQKEDEPLRMGYDKDMSRRFKFYADKYAIGAYDNQTRSKLANYVLGRYFTMFSTWLSARIANAFSGDRYIRDGGRWRMSKDEEGKYLMEWEQLHVEGYVNTVFKTARLIMQSGGFNNLKYMNDVQRRNWNKMVISMSIYATMLILYNLLVDDDKDKDDKGIIPDWRLVKNVKYAAWSMFVIPNLVEKLNNPIPIIRIIRNTFFDYGGNMRFEFPSVSIAETYTEPFEE